MLFSMFYFLDYIAVPIVMAWFLQPVLVAATLFRQSSHSRYYDWARKKTDVCSVDCILLFISGSRCIEIL